MRALDNWFFCLTDFRDYIPLTPVKAARGLAPQTQRGMCESPARARPFSLAITDRILHESARWRQRHRHVCCGCRLMSVCLEVDGIGVALRWMPWDYKLVLKMLKTIIGFLK